MAEQLFVFSVEFIYCCIGVLVMVYCAKVWNTQFVFPYTNSEIATSKLCFSICNVMHFVTINFAITDVLISRQL